MKRIHALPLVAIAVLSILTLPTVTRAGNPPIPPRPGDGKGRSSATQLRLEVAPEHSSFSDLP